MLVLVVLIAILWRTPVVIPLKILVVFLHELSHAVATVLTGGSVVGMTLDPMQGGSVTSRGGWRFVILSAGYLGSLLIGVALFLAAVKTRWDRVILGGLGVVLLAVTLLYLRSLFAIGFGVVTGVLMIGAAKYLRRDVNDLVLRVIGLASMIYVPLDIFSDTIARAHLRSDARMMAEEFAGPTLFWGGAWLLVSLWVIWLCLRRGLGRSSNIAWR
ncbi:MAG: M50 family metallopeptidase [Roseovarius sp.]|nr:M50 family metallopeptidase [Roseovarius sp.]MDM8166838.1 M50 family metallopeptidase [Roseovarius sp.]